MTKFYFLLSLLLSGAVMHAQLPELMYYQFEDGNDSVQNQAAQPVGDNYAKFTGVMRTDPAGGFMNTATLAGDSMNNTNFNGFIFTLGGEGMVESGWSINLNGSFTIGFLYESTSTQSFRSELFLDSAAGLSMEMNELFVPILQNPPNPQFLFRYGGAQFGVQLGSVGPYYIHIVYDAEAAQFRAYRDGIFLTQAAATSVNPAPGSGFKLGRALPSLFPGFPTIGGLIGKMDEFRFYDRALPAGEIANTYNVSLFPEGDCPAFSMEPIQNISSLGAEFNWTPGAGNEGWYLEYGPAGFTPGNGTMVTGTYPNDMPPYALGGLDPDQDYEVYFGEICANGNDTVKNYTLFFSTLPPCMIAAPWSEDFEDSDYWESGVQLNNRANAIDPCWFRPGMSFIAPNTSGGIHAFGTRTGMISGINTGPTGAHTGTNYVVNNVSAGSIGDTATIVTPPIDLSALSDPYLSFYYHRFGNNMPDFFVDANDGSGWTRILHLKGAQQSAQSDPYKVIGADLSGFGDTVNIRFRTVRLSTVANQTSITAFDSVWIDEAPACPEVYQPSLTAITDSSATISFFGTGNTFEFEWGPAGFIPGNGTIETGGNPFTLEGLQFNTDYDVYVRSTCSSGDGEIVSFTTLCLPLQAPYSNGFEFGQTGETPECWIRYEGSPSIDNEAFIRRANPVQFGLGMAYLRTMGGASNLNDTAMLISPPFSDLNELNKQIRFFARVGESSGSNKLYVGTTSSVDGSTFSVVDSFALTDSWQQYTVVMDGLSAYNGSDMHIAFSHGGVEGQVQYIDNFHYERTPACASPSAFSVEAHRVMDSSAYIHWSGGQGSRTTIEWGAPGFMPDHGQEIGKLTTTEKSVVLQNLIPNTEYTYYIKDSCGNFPGGWVGPFSFHTLSCGIVTGPYQTAFDGSPWQSGSGTFNLGDQMDQCWSRFPPNQDTYYKWGMRSGSATSSTGPNSDNSAGNGNYLGTVTGQLGFSGIVNPGGLTAYVYSPIIDVSNVNVPYLTFYTHRYGVHLPELFVEVNDGSGWQTILTLTGEAQTAHADPFEEQGVPLLPYGDTIQIRFRAISFGGAFGQLAIDNFSIEEAPACVPPLNLGVSELSQTSALVSWAPASGSDSILTYEFCWGPQGFAQGTQTGHCAFIGDTNKVLLDSLEPGTCYEFTVRTLCVSGGVTELVQSAPFCTPCHPETVPFYENFEGLAGNIGDSIGTKGKDHDCWNQVIRSGTYKWLINSGQSFGADITGVSGDATSGSGVYIYTESWGNTSNNGDSTILYSPFVQPDASDTVLNVHFAYHMNGGDIGELAMDLYDGSTWHNRFVVISGRQQFSRADPWKDTLVDISMHNHGDPIQVRFRTRKQGMQGHIALDDFYIINCNPATGLVVDSVSCSTADINWEAFANNVYNLEYGPPGYTYGSMIAVRIDSVGPPYTITGLAPNEQYDLYLTDSCAIDVLGPISINTPDEPKPQASFIFSVDLIDSVATADFDASATVDADDYFWDLGDGTTDTASVLTHQYDSNGTYIIRLIVQNVCGSDTLIDTLVVEGIDVRKYSSIGNLRIFPNPNDGRFSVEFDHSVRADLQIELIDMTGKQIWQEVKPGFVGPYRKDFDFLQSAGVYMLRIRTGEGQVVKRIIVQP